MGPSTGKTGFRAEVDFGDEATALAAYTALLPEIGTSRRFTARLTLSGSVLVLDVVASDLSALRAALNSYLRWIGLMEKLQKSLNPH